MKIEDVRDLLLDLAARGVRVTENAGRLRVQAQDKELTAEVAAEIASRKPEILAFLRRTAAEVPREPIPVAPPGPAPLAFAQEELWLADQMAPGGSAFKIGLSLRLDGVLDRAALDAALIDVATRHASLRTRFGLVDGRAAQVVTAEPSLVPDVVNLASLDAKARNEAIESAIAAEMEQPFVGAFARARLLLVEPTTSILLLTVHHGVCDAWSAALLVREILLSYSAHAQGRPSPLLDPPRQMADIATWQRTQPVDAPGIEFWRETLRDVPVLGLPSDRPRSGTPSFRGGSVPVHFQPDLMKDLTSLGRDLGATPFMVLLAGFAAILARWSGQEDFAVGTPTSGRFRPETREMIGSFAYPLVIRMDGSGRPTFAELIRRVRARALQAYEHEQVPYANVATALAQDGRRGTPPFTAMFSFPPADTFLRLPKSSDIPGLQVTLLGELATTGYDLFLLLEGAEECRGSLTYALDLFDEGTGRALIAQMEALLKAAVQDPLAPVDILPLGENAPSSDAAALLTAARALDDRATSASFDRVRVVDPSGRSVPQRVRGELTTGTEDRRTGLSAWWRNDRLEVGEPLGGTLWCRGIEVQPAIVSMALRRAGASDAVLRLRRRPDGAAELVAYVVGVATSAARERLRERVAQTLPAGWTPHNIVPIVALPLQRNGNIDEEALRAIPILDSEVAAQVEARGHNTLAAVIEETTDPLVRLHLADLVPGWRQGAESSDAASTETSDSLPVDRTSGPEAYADGGPLHWPADAPRTLVDALLRSAEDPAGRGITYIAADGAREFQSWAELLHEARRIATGLRAMALPRGAGAILQIPSLKEHFSAFWGCVLAGLRPVTVAVPPTYSEDNAVVMKLANTWKLLQGPLVLTGDALAEEIAHCGERMGLENLRVVAVGTLRGEPLQEIDRPEPDDVVFYQLTSGSTGIPKCIQETHRGVIAHVLGSTAFCGYTAEDVVLSWLPVDHVVPTLTIHLRDVVLGCSEIQVKPDRVLTEPLRWLELIETYRVTHTWAPNFGFKLVADRLAADDRRRFDLSSIRYFMNAGEQVTVPVVREFLRLTAPFGVANKAMQPAFGMAEVCTCMTYQLDYDEATGVHRVLKSSLGGKLIESDGDERTTTTFVDLGGPMPGVEIRITDAENRVVPEGVIGRFQIRGVSVTPGYLNNDEANRDAFVGDGWFNSGDLGFILRGRLSLTGREKEMIIVRGANYYCYEIEDIVNATPGVEATFAAACGIREEASGTEGLAVFFVPTTGAEASDVVRSVKGRVTSSLGLAPAWVVPLSRAEFPKTTSGKIQRTQMKKQLLAGLFDARLRALDLELGSANTVPAWFWRSTWVPRTVLRDLPLPARAHVAGDGDVAEDLRRALAAAGVALVSLAESEVVIDVSGVIAPESPTDSLSAKNALSRDAGLLLGLMQKLQRRPDQTRLLVVARGAQSVLTDDVLSLAGGPVLGLMRTLPEESPQIDVRHIDVDSDDINRIVIAELGDESGERETGWRAGRRFVRRLTRSEIGRKAPLPTALPQGGLWLVSGGTGGIGAILCRHLIDTADSRLLLIGRADPAQVASTPKGALYERADLTDEAAIKAAVERAEAHFERPVAGVLHLAGAYVERPLADETPQTLSAMLEAKALGGWVLGRIAASRQGCRFVAFSSVNATFGGFQVGAYAAANRALDAIVHGLRQGGTKAWNVEWSRWAGVGIASAFTFSERAEARGYSEIGAGQGPRALSAVLHAEDGHHLVGLFARGTVRASIAGTEPLAETLAIYGAGSAPLWLDSLTDRHATPLRPLWRRLAELPRTASGEIDRARLRGAAIGGADQGAPRGETERAVAALWSELLGIASVEREQDFFELGGSSLLATRLVARLQERFSVRFPLQALFRATTVSGMAEVVTALTWAKEGAPEDSDDREQGEL